MVQQATIQDTNREFMEAVKRGDPASLAALYTEDAKVLVPNVEAISGRQGIQALFKSLMEMGVREVTLETVDVEYLGDVAYEVGAYTLKIEPEGGQAATDKGKYVVIWKRQADGRWKLHVDIWNTNTPLLAQ
jgi:uncharacterized protein (TIGR02246 family)